MSEGKQLLKTFGFTEIPESWQVIRLSSLLAKERPISVGVMYPGKNEDIGIPLIRAAELIGHRVSPNPEFKVSPEVNQEYKRTILEGGELLLSLVGDVGRVAVVPKWAAGWNAARAIAVLRLNDPEDASFLRLALQSQPLQFLMRAWSNTTVQMTLNLKEIKEIPLPWPSLAERREIVAILSTLDDKIELNRQMNRTLEAMARALFKSWFVDFDPVRAKMRGEQPEGMDVETAALFPDELEVVEGREVPKGWKVKDLSEVADLNWGNTSITKASYTLGGFDAYSASGLDGKLARFEHDCLGVVVSAIGANAGRTWLARGKWTSIKNTLRFWSTDASISTEYLFMYTDDKGRWPLRGSAQPFIAQGDARRLKILIPSGAISQTFKVSVVSVFESIWQNETESAHLSLLRDALLPRLLSGEVDVSGWAERTEAEEMIA